LPRGDDVVQPTADDPERHRPDGDVRDEAAAPAARAVPTVRDDDREDDPEDDAQRVAAQRQRAEVPDALRRARDGRGHEEPDAFWTAATTRSPTCAQDEAPETFTCWPFTRNVGVPTICCLSACALT